MRHFTIIFPISDIFVQRWNRKSKSLCSTSIRSKILVFWDSSKSLQVNFSSKSIEIYSLQNVIYPVFVLCPNTTFILDDLRKRFTYAANFNGEFLLLEASKSIHLNELLNAKKTDEEDAHELLHCSTATATAENGKDLTLIATV